MTRTAAVLAVVFTAPALAQVDPDPRVILVHDDADGVIEIGETVTWTLTVAFSGDTVQVVDGGNFGLAGDDGLGFVTDFDFTDNVPVDSSSDFLCGTEGGTASGAGFDQIAFCNSLFIEAGSPLPASRDNPLSIGTFEFTAAAAGTLDYLFSRPTNLDFLSLGVTPFESISYRDPSDVTIEVQSLTIVPAPSAAVPLALAGLLATRPRRPTSERSPA